MLSVLRQETLKTPACEELMEVITHGVAKLNIDWPAEKPELNQKSNLDERFLPSRTQSPRRGLLFFPDLQNEEKEETSSIPCI